MPRPQHIEHSVKAQYRTSANLTARNDLHARFGTTRYDWNLWVYDHLGLSEDEAVLDLGCGPAWLWKRNIDRVPTGLRLLLSDASQSMVEEARQNTRDGIAGPGFAVIDAQVMALKAESFDLVIANHMLYHVRDRRATLAEIYRVLKVGGRLVTSTIGRDHMKALRDLTVEFDPGFGSDNRLAENFGLETGRDQLQSLFEDVKVHQHEDTLVVNEARPLADYVASTHRGQAVSQEPQAFLQFLEKRIEEGGPVHIPKVAGLFQATKNRAS